MRKILLTTTESLAGWEIETYLKPLFSNVVVGAGFLSDVSASFTDFFGGRSNSYEKRLQQVNDSALQILQSKAAELGANCIVGLKVNVHQISGKNVQMFMVSAYDTAVIAKSNTVVKASSSVKEIDKSTLVDKAILIKLLKNLNEKDIPLSPENLQLIIDSKSPDFKIHIFNKLKVHILNINEFDREAHKPIEQLYFNYFNVIDPEDAADILYSVLNDENEKSFVNAILAFIKASDLVDYKRCLNLLQSESLYSRKLAIHILTYNKPIYTIEDIEELGNMVSVIQSSFPDLTTISSKKGFLSSNEKEVWLCTCGKSNDTDTKYCNGCSKNKFGFKSEELKPEAVISDLNNKILALKDLFASSAIV